MGNTAAVPWWAVVVLVVVGWLVLAVGLGLGLGAVIRRRDQQRADTAALSRRPPRDSDHEA
jgi:hypothetical protein